MNNPSTARTLHSIGCTVRRSIRMRYPQQSCTQSQRLDASFSCIWIFTSILDFRLYVLRGVSRQIQGHNGKTHNSSCQAVLKQWISLYVELILLHIFKRFQIKSTTFFISGLCIIQILLNDAFNP